MNIDKLTPIQMLLVAGVGLWRLCSLAANEQGPFYIFFHIRAYARLLNRTNRFWKAFHLYKGLCCEWCNSIWVAVPFIVLWLWLGNVMLYALLPFVLSAVVIMFKYAVQTLEQVCDYYSNLNKQFKRGD